MRQEVVRMEQWQPQEVLLGMCTTEKSHWQLTEPDQENVM